MKRTFFSIAMALTSAAWATENVEGFVEVGEVGRVNAKLPVPAVETVRDGNRFLFTVRGKTPPPGDLFVSVKPLDGVEKNADCATVPRSLLYDERFPTHFVNDVRVRRFVKEDGSALAALQSGGDERIGKARDAEPLVFVRRGDGEWRAIVEFRREIVRPLPTDPLEYPHAYSLEIDEDGFASDTLFPVGILGENTGRGFCAHVGGNYFGGGSDDPRGVYGVSCWAAILAKHVKANKRTRLQGGQTGNDANLFDPTTREWIFNRARTAVSNAVAKSGRRVFKWEIDNEYLPGFDYSPEAVAAFRLWLPGWYKGDAGKFNRAWRTNGLDFAEAVPPRTDEYAAKPGAWMDWTRFQQETFADFLADYYRAFQSADPEKRMVNGKDTQSSLEMPRIARYRRGNHELIGQKVRDLTGGVRGMDHYGHGDRNAYEMNCYYNTIAPDSPEYGRRIGMLYGENNNHNGPGWQFEQTIWRMIPNGLRGGQFFCNGWFGCWGDWASFSFVNPDGTLRDKFWSLPRFFGTIHRSERFFTVQAPAAYVPRLAILFAQRDLPFAVDDNISPWGFGINSRLRLFSHLRDAGYYVEVIGYEKLNPRHMKHVDGLFLCGAEHLSDEDIENIRAYVKGGGCLFCDVRCGAFDEHHILRERNAGLSDVLGVQFEGLWVSDDVVVDPGDVWFPSPWGNLVRADGRVKHQLTTAKVTDPRHALCQSNKAAIITENTFGKGRAYWTNTQLGTIRSESSDGEVPAREFFRALLARSGLRPSYSLVPDVTCRFRAENPMTDGKGNYVIAVAGRTYEPLPPSTFAVKLPRDAAFESAWIARADETELRPLAFSRTADGAAFSLPEIKSAAMIYLFRDHPVLIGMRLPQSCAHADGDVATPMFKPGDVFEVTVQAVNPSAKEAAGGILALRAPEGWTVTGEGSIGPLPVGGSVERVFKVQIPAESPAFIPNTPWPLVADFTAAGKRTAVFHAAVALDIEKEGHELLLTDNWSTDNYPWADWTGADYRWLDVPDAENGEAIKDDLWTYLPCGTDVYALLSGDRNDRRKFATIEKMPEATAEFDLKSVRDVTRVLVRYGGKPPKLLNAPWKVSFEFSADGKTFGAWREFAPDWQGPYADFRFDAEKARFVRVRFSSTGTSCVVDEVWIFGR